MQTSTDVFSRLRHVTNSVETLRDDLSAALVSVRTSEGADQSELVRMTDLHSRLSTAMAALSGEIRDH